jgi:hypothetical protein
MQRYRGLVCCVCDESNAFLLQKLSTSLNAFSQCDGLSAMTAQAQGADVGQVAFAAAMNHRQDVVGVPQGFARAASKSPVLKKHYTASSSRETDFPGGGDGVDSANGTDAAVALKHFFT